MKIKAPVAIQQKTIFLPLNHLITREYLSKRFIKTHLVCLFGGRTTNLLRRKLHYKSLTNACKTKLTAKDYFSAMLLKDPILLMSLPLSLSEIIIKNLLLHQLKRLQPQPSPKMKENLDLNN